MLKRKITNKIENLLKTSTNKMIIVDGARQIGKSFTIREIGQRLFPNYIEINMEEDKQNDRVFAEAKTVDSFYFALSSVAGDKMNNKEDTLVFIDEIQTYEHLLTLAKFLVADKKYTFIASGSLLGVTLSKTQSIPIGSIETLHMFPLDFEEFLWANGVGTLVTDQMKNIFESTFGLSSSKEECSDLPESIHNKILGLFCKYLLVGGLPDAVNTYLKEHNIVKVRSIHNNIQQLYSADAAKYERESARKLKIQRIYSMIPSSLENHKKRIVVKDIEGKSGKRTTDYQDEFDYLFSSGIALEVDAISQPTYPLIQNAGKNLLKLYISDVGLLTNMLYQTSISPILGDELSVNLGSVYENVVAQELKAHGCNLFYYDNKKNGEVDFLIDDVSKTTTMPIEVKSGKDYRRHSSLDRFIRVPEYNIHRAVVLSNERNIYTENGIIYLPIYYVMFFSPDALIDKAEVRF